MKTLIVLAHPNLIESKVNSQWIKALEKYPDEFVIHNLYNIVEKNEFNIINEQKLIEKYDHVILQFPIYWFNCPPLMKKWLDDIFLNGWAYGNNNKMKNRKVSLLVTAGIKEQSYSKTGKYQHTINEVLLPFELSFKYMEANYRGFYAFYSAEFESYIDRINESIPEMISFIRSR